ncbi:ATP synthase regulation protein NCA2-domain-containing protein [Crepidotus variabilis]|uniref:ATP synthase regulation protein NCA2-domain-containing protein n=1 Tax=Crepidotus variabilis TaxID=179855 RepID=A0A9P6EKJ4_9AGAR|nr:ATP synthase regulation protein NCA2-domain-containing protein [Crepidotus variabilis]
MPSEYVNHFTRSLAISTSRPPSPPPTPRLTSETPGGTSGYRAFKKSTLHELLVKLNQAPISPVDVQIAVRKLRDLGPPVGISGGTAIRIDDADTEENTLEEAVVGKLAVALYSDALDTSLAQATQAESEAQWWADIEHSTLGVLLYLLQTLPQRFSNAAATIVDTLRRHRMPINISTLSPSSLRSLFSTPRFSIRPSALTVACFPHLRNQQSLSTTLLLSPPRNSAFTDEGIQSAWSTLVKRISDFHFRATRLIVLPLELTRQECTHNRKALERIRDQRAEVIGQLAQLRTSLSDLMQGTNSGVLVNGFTRPSKKYASFLHTLQRVVASSPQAYDFSGSESPLEPLDALSTSLTLLKTSHVELLEKQRLLRPSRLTRFWPSLLVLPPLSLYMYSNYTYWIPATAQMLRDAKDTLRGFVDGWLIEPLVSVLRTVRAGGGGDVLVHAEGVVADLESLERMTLSLARDSLNYTPEQLQVLSEKVRLGDLTPVMQAYEADIRTPLRSAVSGNLLRTVLIQVQKAKVDIDQALSGIDKLLKSQELTFAFVGVAPALTVVYVLGGFLGQVWTGTIGKGRWGGKRRRRGVWEGLRRVERLLIRQVPASEASSSESSSPVSRSESASASLPPLPTGLVILSLTQLRSYALQHLPSDIRDPFLEDLADLEDPTLGKQAKLKVVERMWRCWGSTGTGIIHF